MSVAVALLAGGCLSGCGGSGEPSLAASVAKSGVLGGGITEALKREDDEDEQRELSERAPMTREERAEAREQAEAASAGSEQGEES